jgi:hypothetical protein
MDMTSVLTVSIAAATGLVGPLASQVLAAKAALRAKRFEVYFQAKASKYAALLERIGEFACSPVDQGKYEAFLAAYETALLFASEKVAEALRGPSGLIVNAHRLRMAPTNEKRDGVAATTWYDAAKEVSAAMRNDLGRLSDGLQ